METYTLNNNGEVVTTVEQKVNIEMLKRQLKDCNDFIEVHTAQRDQILATLNKISEQVPEKTEEINLIPDIEESQKLSTAKVI